MTGGGPAFVSLVGLGHRGVRVDSVVAGLGWMLTSPAGEEDEEGGEGEEIVSLPFCPSSCAICTEYGMKGRFPDPTPSAGSRITPPFPLMDWGKRK